MISSYAITGMTCGHCVKAISDEVKAVDGVTEVEVKLDGGTLQVTSAAPIDFAKIAEAVDEAGDYQVTPT